MWRSDLKDLSLASHVGGAALYIVEFVVTIPANPFWGAEQFSTRASFGQRVVSIHHSDLTPTVDISLNSLSNAEKNEISAFPSVEYQSSPDFGKQVLMPGWLSQPKSRKSDESSAIFFGSVRPIGVKLGAPEISKVPNGDLRFIITSGLITLP